MLAAVKTVTPERIREAFHLGVRRFGENRVQERAGKRAALAEFEGEVEWHLLGPLQSNKAALALELFSTLETVDSIALSQRLNRIAERLGLVRVPVLLEVNLAGEAQKAGVPAAGAVELAAATRALPRLELRGL
ncbi:MAG: alanine racemase, partial [Terriglobales bacterium]